MLGRWRGALASPGKMKPIGKASSAGSGSYRERGRVRLASVAGWLPRVGCQWPVSQETGGWPGSHLAAPYGYKSNFDLILL